MTRKQQPLECWLREVEAAAAKLAGDLERNAFYEDPQAEANDIEICCAELLSYIRYYREEIDRREADAEAELDPNAEFRHQLRELV